MSPAAEAQKSSKSSKLGGKEFEETFKPKGKDGLAGKDLEGKKEKGKKKKLGLRIIIIIIMIFVVLVGGAGAALYFSGNLTTIFEAVGLAEPSEGGPTIEDLQAALTQRETALNEKEKSLNDLQVKLDAQQKAFDDAEAAASASAAANKTFEEILAGLSEEKIAELKQVGSIYSKMDAAAAAAIMTKIFDDQQIAVIVYHMQPAATALVLEKLDAGLAASVTQILAS